MSAACAEPISLSPEAAAHDLALLIAGAPERVRGDLEYVADELRGKDTAEGAAAWCDEWARSGLRSVYEHEFYDRAAGILRAALPGLPEKAPPKPPDLRPSVGQVYSESERVANRRGARRRRG